MNLRSKARLRLVRRKLNKLYRSTMIWWWVALPEGNLYVWVVAMLWLAVVVGMCI